MCLSSWIPLHICFWIWYRCLRVHVYVLCAFMVCQFSNEINLFQEFETVRNTTQQEPHLWVIQRTAVPSLRIGKKKTGGRLHADDEQPHLSGWYNRQLYRRFEYEKKDRWPATRGWRAATSPSHTQTAVPSLRIWKKKDRWPATRGWRAATSPSHTTDSCTVASNLKKKDRWPATRGWRAATSPSHTTDSCTVASNLKKKDRWPATRGWPAEWARPDDHAAKWADLRDHMAGTWERSGCAAVRNAYNYELKYNYQYTIITNVHTQGEVC